MFDPTPIPPGPAPGPFDAAHGRPGPGPGRIDIHCHILPGIDDGCKTVEESFECVRKLTEAGFIGSICTPHIWPDTFPENTVANIRQWAAHLQKQITAAGLQYRLWTGGEVRFFKGIEKHFSTQELPVLGNSRYVLVDCWDQRWPDWLDATFDWLLGMKYHPILAHPERIPGGDEIEDRLKQLQAKGVWLQGNCNSITGMEGFKAEQRVQRWLSEGKYKLLALDMHGPDTLDTRLVGMDLAIEEHGQEKVDEWLSAVPRKILARG